MHMPLLPPWWISQGFFTVHEVMLLPFSKSFSHRSTLEWVFALKYTKHTFYISLYVTMLFFFLVAMQEYTTRGLHTFLLIYPITSSLMYQLKRGKKREMAHRKNHAINDTAMYASHNQSESKSLNNPNDHRS